MRCTPPVCAVLLVAATACGGEAVPCGAACPDVSGDYALDTWTLTGACPFDPYTAPPVITLAQTADGTVSSTLHDPIDGAPQPLGGPLLEPDDPSALVDFAMTTRQVRPASVDLGTLLDFRVLFAGSIVDEGGRYALVGALSTTGVPVSAPTETESGCTLTVHLTARR